MFAPKLLLAGVLFATTPALAAPQVCAWTVEDGGVAPATRPPCGFASDQVEPEIEPGTTRQIAFGTTVTGGRDDVLNGPFNLCLPVPVGVTIDGGDPAPVVDLYDSSSGLTSGLPASPSLDLSTADGNIQGTYCVAFGDDRTTVASGDVVYVSSDYTFAAGSGPAEFFAADDTTGSISACGTVGGSGVCFAPVALPKLTQPVKSYVARIDGCGFDFYETNESPTAPDCQNNPGAQTSPGFSPGATKRVVYGAGVPTGSDTATLAGVYGVCLPLPHGVSWTNAHAWLTSHGGTTELVGHNTRFALDTDQADAAIQGQLCLEEYHQVLLAPGDKLWISVDLTFGSSDVTFADASNQPGSVSTNCSQGGGNATECPIDNLPLLTVDIDLKTATIDGCGIDVLEPTDSPVAPTCSNNPGEQSAGPVAPGTTQQLVYGLGVPAGKDNATLAGIFEACLPLPIGVSMADPHLYLTNKLGTAELISHGVSFALNTGSADSAIQGHYCVTYSGTALVGPGDTLWVSVDATLPASSVTFTDEDGFQGSVGTDCSLPGGNADACPIDKLPALTIEVEQLETVIDGCGILVLDPSTAPPTPTCVDNPPPQDGPTLSPGATAQLVYGLGVPSRGGYATLPGVFEICLPLPIGLVTADPHLYLTNGDGTTELLGKFVKFELTGSADGSVQGDYCATYSGPNLVAPGDVLFVSLDVTFGSSDVVFADAEGTPGSVGTDCSLPGGNGNACPIDNLPALTVHIGSAAGVNNSLSGGALQTSEDGSTDAVVFSLTRQPTADVTFTVSASDPTEGEVTSNATVVLGSGNWSTGVTVEVKGLDDSLIDGDVSFTLTLSDTTSDDAAFDGLELSDIGWTNQDDDSAEFLFDLAANEVLLTSEDADADTFEVSLSSQPASTVTVTVASTDTDEGTVSPTTLTFQTDDWSTAQTVTVTGVDDPVIDGTANYHVTLTASGGGTGWNGAYFQLDAQNADNDVAGVAVVPTGAGALETSESGTQLTFDVALPAKPTADVTLAITVDDANEGSVSPNSMTFTPDDWDTAQTLTVTGVNDFYVDGTRSYQVTLTASSDDGDFDGESSDIEIDNLDNDVASGVVTPMSGLVTQEDGTSATFTVVLTSQPAADVTIPITSLDEGEGLPDVDELVFTASDWSVAQTVTVAGQADGTVDGDQTYAVEVGVATSSDASFNGLDLSDVTLTNLDLDEEGTDTGTVDTGDTGDVVDTGDSADTGDTEDTDRADTGDVEQWVDGGECACNGTGGSWTLLGLVFLPLIRRRR